jgi:tetratricopeptide (TPR) repeat protein
MGILDGLLGGSYEKHEARGDRAMKEEDPTGAAQAFRAALRKVEGKDPGAEARLRDKVDAADDAVIRGCERFIREHLEDGDPDVAEDQLEVARGFTRDHPGKYDDLLRSLERAIEERRKADAAHADTHYDRQMQESLREEDVSAETIEYEQVLGALGPEDAIEAQTYGPHFQKGYLALTEGDFLTAVEELELATHERPESAIIYEVWGKALEMAGRSPEARSAYRKALERDPSRRDARLSLANLLDSLDGRDQDAVELLREGLEVSPDSEPMFRMSIAAIHLHKERPELALAEMQPLFKVRPDGNAELWQLYGSAEEMAGDLDQAEKGFVASYAMDSRNPSRRIQYAEFCLRHGRSLDAAEHALISACQACGVPDSHTMATLSFYLAQVYSAQERYDDALTQVTRALEDGVPPDMEEQFRELKRTIEDTLE